MVLVGNERSEASPAFVRTPIGSEPFFPKPCKEKWQTVLHTDLTRWQKQISGWSAKVYPAAYLPVYTARAGGTVIEINPERTQLSAFADLRVTDVDWAERLLEALEQE